MGRHQLWDLSDLKYHGRDIVAATAVRLGAPMTELINGLALPAELTAALDAGTWVGRTPTGHPAISTRAVRC